MAVKTRRDGETTRCEHYGGGGSNRVTLDLIGKEVVDPVKVEMVMNVSNGMPCYMCTGIVKNRGVEIKKTLDVTEVEVECPGKVENRDCSKEHN